MMATLKNVLDRSRDEPMGCGFLKPDEVDTLLNSALDAKRSEQFRKHQAEGCTACALLAADAQAFHDVVARGPLESERREYGQSERILAAELRRRLEEAARDERKPTFSWNFALGAAAAAMLLAAALIPIVREGNLPGLGGSASDSEYELQAVPFADRPVLRDTVRLADLWSQAGTAYVNGDYAGAESLFRAIQKAAPDDYDARVYRAFSLIQIDRPGTAIEVLEDALRIADEEGLSGSDANYLLGYVLWKQGRTSAAVHALQQVIEAGGVHEEPAQTLLDQINLD